MLADIKSAWLSSRQFVIPHWWNNALTLNAILEFEATSTLAKEAVQQMDWKILVCGVAFIFTDIQRTFGKKES
jgi:hypothetical protein